MSPRCGVMLILGTLRYMQMFFLLRRDLINGETIVAVQSQNYSLAGTNFLFQLAFILFAFAVVCCESASILTWKTSEDLTFSRRP